MARKKKQTTKSTRDSVTLDSVFTGIADAIRAKTGGSDTITPRNMGNAIRGIKGVTEASLPEANLPSVFQDIANAIRACGITGTMTASQMAGKIGDIVVFNPATTKVKYTSASGLPDWEGNVVGELTSSSIPNKDYIETADIGNTVTSISSSAFDGCSGLTSVTIPDSVTSIGAGAFASCIGLTSVTIPDSVSSIGDSAFYHCYGLTSVTIPDSVTSIKTRTFWFCTNLQSVTIPNSITYIGDLAFCYCRNLSEIIIQKTITETQAMSPDNWLYAPAVGASGLVVTITCTDGSFTITVSCLLKGTDILLANGTTKKVEDLTYADVLKVWDFDEGQLGSAKVCWLTRPGLKSNHYYQLTFDDGTVLKTTGINSNHCIFSVDQSKFTNVADAKVGDKVFSIDGTLTIIDVKYVEEECEYYNVMTSGKINCFANGILTSDRYGNLYPIADMKYVKDGRTIRPYSEYEAVGIDRYWYDNLRLGENTETVEKSKQYVWKCIGQMLPIPN